LKNKKVDVFWHTV